VRLRDEHKDNLAVDDRNAAVAAVKIAEEVHLEPQVSGVRHVRPRGLGSHDMILSAVDGEPTTAFRASAVLLSRERLRSLPVGQSAKRVGV